MQASDRRLDTPCLVQWRRIRFACGEATDEAVTLFGLIIEVDQAVAALIGETGDRQGVFGGELQRALGHKVELTQQRVAFNRDQIFIKVLEFNSGFAFVQSYMGWVHTADGFGELYEDRLAGEDIAIAIDRLREKHHRRGAGVVLEFFAFSAYQNHAFEGFGIDEIGFLGEDGSGGFEQVEIGGQQEPIQCQLVGIAGS